MRIRLPQHYRTVQGSLVLQEAARKSPRDPAGSRETDRFLRNYNPPTMFINVFDFGFPAKTYYQQPSLEVVITLFQDHRKKLTAST